MCTDTFPLAITYIPYLQSTAHKHTQGTRVSSRPEKVYESTLILCPCTLTIVGLGNSAGVSTIEAIAMYL